MTTTITILFAALILWRLRNVHDHIVEHINRMRGSVMVHQQETLDALTALIKKGTAEVVSKIADLQAQVDDRVPVEDLDLSELTAAAQALDAIVPDPVVDAPADVPVPVDVPADEPVDNPPF